MQQGLVLVRSTADLQREDAQRVEQQQEAEQRQQELVNSQLADHWIATVATTHAVAGSVLAVVRTLRLTTLWVTVNVYAVAAESIRSSWVNGSVIGLCVAHWMVSDASFRRRTWLASKQFQAVAQLLKKLLEF